MGAGATGGLLGIGDGAADTAGTGGAGGGATDTGGAWGAAGALGAWGPGSHPLVEAMTGGGSTIRKGAVAA